MNRFLQLAVKQCKIISILIICIAKTSFTIGQTISYIPVVADNSMLIFWPPMLPENKLDGNYKFEFAGNGFILGSYLNTLPEGLWSYFSSDSILISISYFHKGEIIYAQYYESGYLKYETFFEFPFMPQFGSMEKISGIGLYGTRGAYLDRKSIHMVEFSPTIITRRYYESGKLKFEIH